MSHAEKCPICGGRGTLCNHDVNMPLSLHPTCPTCHGCWGTGWVTIQDSEAYAWMDYKTPGIGGTSDGN